jgi:hypothetical protein
MRQPGGQQQYQQLFRGNSIHTHVASLASAMTTQAKLAQFPLRLLSLPADLQIDPLAMDDAVGGGDGSNLWHQQAEASGQPGTSLGTAAVAVPGKAAAAVGVQGSSMAGGDVEVRGCYQRWKLLCAY